MNKFNESFFQLNPVKKGNINHNSLIFMTWNVMIILYLGNNP